MKKKVSSIFKLIVLSLLLIFIVIYVSDMKGYYAYSNYKKNILTEEGIRKFENDVENGNPIDVNEYVVKEKDYSNKISKTTLKISNKLGSFIRKGIVNFFDGITSHIE